MIIIRLLVLVLLLFLNPVSSLSFRLEWVRSVSISELNESDFLDIYFFIDSINTEYDFSPDNYFYLEEGEKQYLLPDNYSYTFKWNGQKFQNLYGGYFHGFNKGAFKWIFNEKIYSYGGWVDNMFFSEVIFFDEDLHQWELVGWLGDKPNPVYRQPIFIFNQGNKLFSLFDVNRAVYPPFHSKKWSLIKNNLFEYDQINKTWQAIKRIQTTNLPEHISGYVNLKDYLVFWEQTIGTGYIMEKHTLSFKKMESSDLLISNWDSSDYVVYQNQIRFFNNGQLSPTLFIDQEFQRLGSIQYLNNRKTVLMFLVLTSFGVPIFIYVTRRGNFLKQKETFPFPVLLEYKGKIISQEELDFSIGVSKEVSESARRNRRSKILRSLNSYHHLVKVERIRNDLDSRVFSYKIT